MWSSDLTNTQDFPSRYAVLGRIGSASELGLAAANAAGTSIAADATDTAKYRCNCGLVDAHSHFLPPVYAHALADNGLVTLDGGFPVPQWSEEKALAHMEKYNIETSMLSVSSPTVAFLKEASARERMARELNEFSSALVKRTPQRFGAFATLPLTDIQASLTEIGYSLDVLKLDGAVMETNVHGIYLGDPRLDPVFAELNRRKATVFLHPTSPPCFAELALGRPSPILEFPLDTSRAVTDLIFAGTLTRYQNIRMIISHGGGALPAVAERIARFSTLPFLKQKPAGGAAEVKQVLASLYFDLAGSASDASIERLRRITSLKNILFGSDFPFTPSAGIDANVEDFRILSGLTASEHEGIARDNAKRIFPRLSNSANESKATPG